MLAFVGVGPRIIRIGIDFGTAGGLLVINTATTGADFVEPCFESFPLRYCDFDLAEAIQKFAAPTYRFTMPKAEPIYRPKITKPQWTPTTKAPLRMLRCDRKGIGLRIKKEK
ncbi:MAG: hypothetical protein UY18_C0050G0015 [Microgenomates group bacterium GW2011_GWF2_47_9]|nr:MAG: hypothetical protein UY18_C0050G0015 [Microgenomates group bacterium GW2011_GWF2_47_9]